MKVSVIGSGYVGLVTGAGLASLGHEITCIDIDGAKVEKMNRGVPPFFEEGLPELLTRVIAARKFNATTNYSSVASSEIVLICVGTPSRDDGSVDLQYAKSAAESIGRELKAATRFITVAVKSTVVPGSTRSLIPILEAASGKKAGKDFGVGMVPEFLREGVAIDDFYAPDRVVIGALEQQSMSALKQLHSSYKCPVVETTLETAEMIKYASNSFLATKISFTNELAVACERMGISIDDVAKGMGLDKRINPHFLNAGPGWGGSCFGKDVKALLAAEKQAGLGPHILMSVLGENERHKRRVVELAEKAAGSLKGKRVAVLGLAFKAGTDDIRDSPAITIVKDLLSKGAIVSAFDPQAMDNFKRVFPSGVEYAKSVEECISKAQACVIVTEWKEFRIAPAQFPKLMAAPVVVDARRLMDGKAMAAAGVQYQAVGVGKPVD